MGVRVNDPTILARLEERFPPGHRPGKGPVVDRLYSFILGGATPGSRARRYHILYVDGCRGARTLDLEEALTAFQANVDLYIAEQAHRRVFLHAGVVGWKGQAILIPGRTHGGKSTLVTALVRAGATYYSDEFAVLDGRGRVHPDPRPLAIWEQGGMVKRTYPVESLGGRPGVQPIPVGLVLASGYRAGARWRPRPLSHGQALMELLAHAVPAHRKPSAVLSTLKQVVLNAPTLKGARGEAEEIAESVLERADTNGQVPVRAAA